MGYATKSKKGNGGLPKMVLIGDIVGDDADEVARVTSEVVRLANTRSGRRLCGHQRRSAQEVLGRPQAHRPPSASHTNAFKINEDVVIPLPRMAEYTDGHRAHQHRAEPAQQAGLVSMHWTAFFETGTQHIAGFMGKSEDADELPNEEA